MITNLLFDLDNTLYPSTNMIDTNILKRMIAFISEFLNLSHEDAAELRRARNGPYGTTLEWLRTEYNFTDVEAYFQAVHPDEEKNEVDFDPNLRPFLQKLSENYHLTVLTNAPKIHADCILNHLHIYDMFDGVYDVESNDLKGKPHRNAYLKAIEEKGFTVAQTLFFDDYPKYIKGYSDIGGKGVLVDSTDEYKNDPLTKEAPFARIRTIYEIPALLENFKNELT